jgi:hypothetical protein
MSIGTRFGRVLAATLIGVAGGVVATSSSATAAGACAKGTGVTVVVGSGVGCDSNGGSPAASNFTDAGHSLTYVDNSSFVCKVDGSPNIGCARTPPTDNYWGLFWSNGTSGKWTYASAGVSSLKVPTGGWVAFVLQKSSTTVFPGVTPLAAAPAKPKPTSGGSTKPSSGGGSAGGATPTAKPTSTSPSSKADKSSKSGTSKSSKSSKADKSDKGSTAPSDGTTTQPGDDLTNTSQETGGSSSLGWIAGALAVVLLGGMGTVAWRRRTAGGRTP